MIEYEPPVYRPPGEWRSFLVQATIGCSHNGCTFCGMYKSKKFRVRPLDDILWDIRETAGLYNNQFEKVFLCDGDAIAMPTEDLLKILEEIRRDFPKCRLISTYAGPISTLKKTPEELKILREAGLGRAYLGIETGMESLLKSVNKGVSRAEMLRAGTNLREAGIDLWGIVLIGLGGVPLSMENARETKSTQRHELYPGEGDQAGQSGSAGRIPGAHCRPESAGNCGADPEPGCLRHAFHLGPCLQLPAAEGNALRGPGEAPGTHQRRPGGECGHSGRAEQGTVGVKSEK